MRSIISKFIKYPILGNAILVAITLFGILSFISTKTTFFPEVPSNTIMISASYPGASPEEIEEGIVLKIEENLKGVTGVDRVTSTSSENSASITVEIDSDYDINVVLQDVKNAVDRIGTFPADMEEVMVYKEERRDFAISLVIYGDVELSQLKSAARDIERDLLAIDGISKISLSGFPDEEIEVSVREDDLRKFDITLSEVTSALKNANIKITGGKIKGKTEEFQIRADTKGYYAADLANHVVKTTSDGTVVRFRDFADLKDTWSEDPNRVYYNGRPAVMVTVNSTNNEDLFSIAETTHNYLSEFNKENNAIIAEVLRDGSQIIEERADLLIQNGFIGMILVLLLLSLTLNLRLSVWVALAIPISFAGMFMISPLYGLTFNVMSLMAMILVIGILVDDGIVIGENIYQKYEQGMKPIKAAVDGTLEVLPAVFSSIMTTVIIFTSFFFLEGSMGDRTKDIAFIVAATLLFSLVEGMFILPAHIAHSKALRIKPDDKNKFEKTSDKALQWLRDNAYLPVLKYCIKYPLVTVAITLAIFIITLGAVKGSIIKTTFFPVLEFDNVQVSLEMPAGTPAAITDSLLADMESAVWLVNDDYGKQYDGDTLVLSISRSISSSHNGSLRVTLASAEKRQWGNIETANYFRNKIGRVEQAENFEVGDRGGHFGKPVAIVLTSDNLDDIRAATEKLKSELMKVDKLKDVVDDDPPGLREVNISLKEKAYALGLTISEVMSQVRSGFFGGEAQRLIRGTDEVKIYVRYDEEERATIDQLGNMRIRPDGDREYPLKEIADFTIKRGVISINHIDAQRTITVGANIINPEESVTDIVADIKADILPGVKAEFPGVRFAFEGQSRESGKTMNAMLKVVPTVLILMFLIIVITFRSFIQALLVLTLIPFALIGVAWGHFFQGYIISMLSFFGTIALAGIVVNDSLVFVNAMNQMLKKDMPFKEALLETGKSRFRPVLLTSLTTIAGLGPLIFEGSFHAKFLSPMAISVAYGLFFGTLLTLLLLPALLSLNNCGRIYVYRLFTGKTLTSEEVEPAVREDRGLLE